MLKDIEHWQDEKEANYKVQRAIREKVEGEAAKKSDAENAEKEVAQKAHNKARADRKATKKASMGEEYQSSGDEAPKEVVVVEDAPAEGGEGEGDVDSMGSKVADFKRKLKQYELDNAFSDDEIAELEIK